MGQDVDSESASSSATGWWVQTYLLVPLVAGGVAGPLAWTRNPMYLGIVTTLASVAVVAASPVVAAYASLLAVVYHLIVTLVEEPKLNASFGESSRAYRNKVPRWIPRRPDD